MSRAEVCYWGPDTLQWQPCGLGHTDFVHWSITDGLDEFYAELRWDGWEHEVAEVALDAGLSVFTFLCNAESRPIAATSRRPIPWDELSQLLDALQRSPTASTASSSARSPERSRGTNGDLP